MAKVTRSTASNDESVRYLTMGMDAKRALTTAARLLAAQQTLTGDPSESLRIGVGIAQLEAEMSRIQAELLAFAAEQNAIEPPDPVVMQRVQDRARELDAIIAGQVLTSTIVDAATDVLARWNATR
jgi:hypothetical protein